MPSKTRTDRSQARHTRRADRPSKLAVLAHLDGHFVPCARLELTEHGTELLTSQLAYGRRYLQRTDALEIDPVSLRLSAARAPGAAEWMLPAPGLEIFGGIRDAAPDAWGRRIIEARLKVPANALPESVYLLESGSERTGALDVRSDFDTSSRTADVRFDDLEHLMQAADRLEQGVALPKHLERLLGQASGTGGARPKATLRDEAGRLQLAKFGSTTDRFDVPAVEAAALEMARSAGLQVSSVRVVRIGGRSVMLIERFDREWHGGVETRIGQISALTLIGVHPAEAHLQSYPLLADAMRERLDARHVTADLRELFKRMVLNMLVNNTDDHLRNHAFVWTGRGWRLSPLYDVVPMPSLAHERRLHLGVGAHGRVATVANALSQCGRFNLSATQARTAIDEVWTVVRQWRVHFEQSFSKWGVAASETFNVASAFRHIDRMRG